MSDYFEWKKDDLEQLKIGDHEFIDDLREGLIPYTKDGKIPIPCQKNITITAIHIVLMNLETNILTHAFSLTRFGKQSHNSREKKIFFL